MSWRPRFTASHLSWTTCPELQHLAVVKVHGVFPSNHGYSASSPRLQFHRIPRRDSAQVVTPFVQVGTSRYSSVSRGADYPFTLAQLCEYAIRVVSPPPTRVHRPRELDDLDQTAPASMRATGHQPADRRKPVAVIALARKQRVPLEVRNDALEKALETARLPFEGLVAAIG